MKNKEFLNVCYKFFNKLISANELIEELTDLENITLLKQEKDEISNLLDNIKRIACEIPNKEDDYIINKKQNIKNLINKLEAIPKEDNNLDFLNKQIVSLKKDLNREMDSHERWFSITAYIDENDYFNKNFGSLTDYELLEFIAQYIQVPFPPQLSQDEFDRLVKVGIEMDEREWLWRLAFNYEKRKINFDEIVDYYISTKDGYYLAELISAVGECLDIDNIINKIDDVDLIKDFVNRKDAIGSCVSEEQYNKLISKMD